MSEANTGINESPLTRLRNLIRPRDTRMAISQTEHQAGITRRSFLRKGAAVVTVAAGVKLGLIASDVLIAPSTVPENQKTVFDSEFTPTEIAESVEISTKGLTVREKPSLTNDGSLPNTDHSNITSEIPFDLIKRFGNLLYEGQDRILVQLAPVLKGQDPITFRKDEGRWIKVRVQQANRLNIGPFQEKDGFINLGQGTTALVKEHGIPSQITGIKDGIVKTADKPPYRIDQIGFVTVLPKAA